MPKKALQRVLIVDDDKGILTMLREELRKDGYEIYTASSGEQALEQIKQHRIDLIVLDQVLPGLNGLEVCRQVRAQIAMPIPIIMLSVRSGEADKVEALLSCANDYVSKPFSIPELRARIIAHLRSVHPVGPVFVDGPLRVDFSEQRVQVNGQDIRLTPTEFRILQVFIEYANKLVTPDMLRAMVWRDEFGIYAHNVHVHVHALRKKIEKDIAPRRFIITHHHMGYRFTTST
jgi:DNA-binding response OmpR family regulator